MQKKIAFVAVDDFQKWFKLLSGLLGHLLEHNILGKLNPNDICIRMLTHRHRNRGHECWQINLFDSG
jgi:hypothetical protein